MQRSAKLLICQQRHVDEEVSQSTDQLRDLSQAQKSLSVGMEALYDIQQGAKQELNTRAQGILHVSHDQAVLSNILE